MIRFQATLIKQFLHVTLRSIKIILERLNDLGNIFWLQAIMEKVWTELLGELH